MKKNQFPQYDVAARGNIMTLMDVYAMATYGIYWIVTAYLRMQAEYADGVCRPPQFVNNFIGVAGFILEKMLQIVKDFGPFYVQSEWFSSQVWVQRMQSLDQKWENSEESWSNST